MSLTDTSFNKIKDEVLACINYNRTYEYEYVKSKDSYIINELLEHFNSTPTADNILFKTCIDKTVNNNRSDVKTSPVIKGDYIKLEEINLHKLNCIS